MEKNINSKLIIVGMLLFIVIGISVGFATYSTTLTIRPGASYVANPDNFKVEFSSNNTIVKTDPIIPIVTPSNLEASNGLITNIAGSKTISGLSANFTAPGQKVEYVFYVANSGDLEAFLKNVYFKNVDGASSNKLCEAKIGTTNSLVNEACENITLNIKIGSDINTEKSISSIYGHNLVKGMFEKVIVTIEYKSGAVATDGDFTVFFGDIALDYSSTDKVN